jgi:hypothetical protein
LNEAAATAPGYLDAVHQGFAASEHHHRDRRLVPREVHEQLEALVVPSGEVQVEHGGVRRLHGHQAAGTGRRGGAARTQMSLERLDGEPLGEHRVGTHQE